jgi:hypothetical protein
VSPQKPHAGLVYCTGTRSDELLKSPGAGKRLIVFGGSGYDGLVCEEWCLLGWTQFEGRRGLSGWVA